MNAEEDHDCPHALGFMLLGRRACYSGKPAAGFCGVTSVGGDCHADTSGAWALGTLRECVLACAGCARCRYLSFSQAGGDCSWFHDCQTTAHSTQQLSPLHQQLSLAYITLERASILGIDAFSSAVHECGRSMHQLLAPAVAPSAPPPSLPLSTTRAAHRLAVATLLHAPAELANDNCSGTGYRCGLLGWCASARRLQRALPTQWDVSIVVLVVEAATMVPAREPYGSCQERKEARLAKMHCPGAVVHTPSRRLSGYIRALSHVARRDNRWWLAKWHLLGRREYEAVLFSDLDVDLLPNASDAAAVGAEWAARLPEVLAARRAGPLRAIVNPDHESAINGGFMLLLPDVELYEDGLEVLRNGFGGPHVGWNGTGTPKQLLGARDLYHRSGRTMLYRHRPARVDNAAWDFVAASSDQGFLV